MRLPGEGRAVFLDRDGTVNREVAYLSRVRHLELLPGAAAALGALKAAGFRLILVSNQSGVARGYFTVRTMKKINRRLERALRREGVRLDGLYACPWHIEGPPGPYRREHPWRKPSPGMLLAAAARFGIDLYGSWMVGDRASDIIAGQRAGCRTVLVRTGYGREAEAAWPADGERPDRIVDDLASAAAMILGEADDG